MFNHEVVEMTEEQEEQHITALRKGIEESKRRAEVAATMSPPLPSPGYTSNNSKEAMRDPRWARWNGAKKDGRLCPEFAESFNTYCAWVPSPPRDGHHWKLVPTTSGPIAPGAFRWKRGEPRWPKDGRHKHPLWGIYEKIWRRTSDPEDSNYLAYGSVGRILDPLFADVQSGFWRFVAEIGPRPSPQHSVNRRDNKLGYLLGNLEWADPRTQAWERSCTRWVDLPSGERVPLNVACRRYGMSTDTVQRRLTLGVPLIEALTEPPLSRSEVANRSNAAQAAKRGGRLTNAELAAIAGCSRSAMDQRLKKMTPEQAVAIGGPIPRTESGRRGGTVSAAKRKGHRL
jgi:hypothetical protein